MMNASSPTNSAQEDTRARVFMRVFIALCGLTLISVLVAWIQIFPSAAANRVVFIGLAIAKASLVICYFMHLRWERYWKYVLTIPALAMGFALGLSLLPDVGMRSNHYSDERIEAGPDKRLKKTAASEQ